MGGRGGEASRFGFYRAQYERFGGELAAEMRREVYGEDLGQQGWRNSLEQEEIAGLLRVDETSHVLDVACGSGGPSLAMAERSGCRLTGIDIEPAALAYAQGLAAHRGLEERVNFLARDCGGRLPFEDAAFDAVLCVDAINHLPDRFGTLVEWARLLKPHGRILFIDPTILTGGVTKAELDIRASLGFYLFVPPGLNERAIVGAGLEVLRVEDRTAAIAEIAARWFAVRRQRQALLHAEEGVDFYDRRQRFLETTAELARSKRLSRFLFLAGRSG
ncbi:MAG TPA: methyltransferase domain-containing protein [Myxococcaceae bacterium]|nr:methyltransferase domain-containing protein [Myxococcaceae bacterium]